MVGMAKRETASTDDAFRVTSEKPVDVKLFKQERKKKEKNKNT